MPAMTRRNETSTPAAGGSTASNSTAAVGSNAARASFVGSTTATEMRPAWFDELQSLIGQARAQEANAPLMTPAGLYETTPDSAEYSASGPYAGPMADNQARVNSGIESQLGLRERDLETFVAHYNANRARYEAVAAQTNIPARLIAALHWRESTGSFNRYLHQGDPIGRPSTNVPVGVLFYDWETAAVDALTNHGKGTLRDQMGITADTTDAAAIATYAEAYNGLGYSYRDQASPYVWAGTAEYTSGKFVRDGVYSASHVDQQLGVIAMVGALGGLDTPIREQTRATEWNKVLAGERLLRNGSDGLAVEALQERLLQLGFELTVDGDFGSGTENRVRQWQSQMGLTVDGVVGRDTASRMDQALRQSGG